MSKIVGMQERIYPSRHVPSFTTDPATELSETVVTFTTTGFDNLRQIVDERRASGDAPPNLPQEISRDHCRFGLGRMDSLSFAFARKLR